MKHLLSILLFFSVITYISSQGDYIDECPSGYDHILCEPWIQNLEVGCITSGYSFVSYEIGYYNSSSYGNTHYYKHILCDGDVPPFGGDDVYIFYNYSGTQVCTVTLGSLINVSTNYFPEFGAPFGSGFLDITFPSLYVSTTQTPYNCSGVTISPFRDFSLINPGYNEPSVVIQDEVCGEDGNTYINYDVMTFCYGITEEASACQDCDNSSVFFGSHSETQTSATLEAFDATSNSTFTWYYKKSTDNNYQSQETTSNSITLTGLIPNTSYDWSVTIFCGTAPDFPSPDLSFMTLPFEPTCDSEGTYSEAVSTTSATLHVSQVSSNTDFEWEYKKESESQWSSPILTSNSSTTITNLESNKNYQWRVEVICPDGSSTNSAIQNFITDQESTGGPNDFENCEEYYDDILCDPVVIDSISSIVEDLIFFDYWQFGLVYSESDFYYFLEYELTSGAEPTNVISYYDCDMNIAGVCLDGLPSGALVSDGCYSSVEPPIEWYVDFSNYIEIIITNNIDYVICMNSVTFNLCSPCGEATCINPDQIDETAGCNLNYTPICGCDGKTYPNQCVAENYYGVTSFSEGACDQNTCIDTSMIDENAICPYFYMPVCGCDGVTYPNGCSAEANGVISYTQGSCITECVDEDLINEDTQCTAIYNPVCGCDGVTYINECYALAAGVINFTPGTCSNIDCDSIIFLPLPIIPDNVDEDEVCGDFIGGEVCGCNAITYENSCIAYYEGIEYFIPGPCEDVDDCFISDPVTLAELELMVCPENEDPVCGCDGMEYDNACKAFKTGIKKWDDESCEFQECQLPNSITFSENLALNNNWQFVVGQVSNAISYQWQIRELEPNTQSWSNAVVNETTLQNIFDWFGYEDCKTYEWRVRIICDNGLTSDWSIGREFETNENCEEPVCTLPAQSTFFEGLALDSNWQFAIGQVSNAITYQWQIREIAPNSQSWSNADVDETTLQNVFDWFDYEDCKTYEWRVRILCDNDLTSEWSTGREFETEDNCESICSEELRYIKIHYKVLLDPESGLPPSVFGQSVDLQYIESIVDWMNSIMIQNNGKFRFCFSFDNLGGIGNTISSLYFNATINGETLLQLEDDAKSQINNGNPYLWASDAINIYMLQGADNGTDAGGVCSYPGIHGENIIIGGRSSSAAHLHEVGHFFNLFHTHEGCDCSTCNAPAEPNDEIDDTLGDLPCWEIDEMANYHFSTNYNSLDIAQQQIVDNSYRNIMSYHSDTYTLTNGQFERWCTAINEFETRAAVVYDTPCESQDCIDESLMDEDAICTLEYIPVCGCNGITYPNSCSADNAGVTFYTSGPCNNDGCIVEIDTFYFCPQIFDPVCGCDGNTYTNSCEAGLAGVTSWTDGVCGAEECTDLYYPLPILDCDLSIYEPVCGCDTITYDNACVAQDAGIFEYDDGACCIDVSQIGNPAACPAIYEPVCDCLGNVYPSPCVAEECGVEFPIPCNTFDCINEDQIDEQIICPAVYEPVCGCDGITYTNSCNAYKNGVTSWDNGPCATNCIDENLINENIPCGLVYEPVCGCDGVSYVNPCDAGRNGLISWTAGPCQSQDCIDLDLIDLNIQCTANVMPVCGCDGETYINSCEARTKAGVTSWTEGPCPSPPIPCQIDDEDNDFSDVQCTANVLPVCGCNDITYINACLALRAGVTDWDPGVCPEDVIGCTEPNSYNYNASATVSDESCQNCYDGIQNGDEAGIDCGGALCPNNCEELADLTFYIEPGTYVCNSVIQVPVRVLNYDNVSSFSYRITTNAMEGIKIIGVSNVINSLTVTPVSQSNKDIRITGFTLDSGLTFADGTVIFYVDVEVGSVDCFDLFFAGGINNDFEILASINFQTLVPTTIGAELCKSEVYDASGVVEREDGLQIESVNIFSNSTVADITDMDGRYNLFNLSSSSNVIISPQHDTKAQDGVNVADVSDINRFILGIAGFDSKYKEVAADINGNKRVDIVDLSLAIGATFDRFETYPSNDTWRFIPQDYAFVRTSDYFKEIYPEVVTNNLFTIDQSPDFYAIKLGDVNYSYDGNKSESIPLRLSFDKDNKMKASIKYQDALGVQFAFSGEYVEDILVTTTNSAISIGKEVYDNGEIGIIVFSLDGNPFDLSELEINLLAKQGAIFTLEDITFGNNLDPILYSANNQSFAFTLEQALSQSDENKRQVKLYPNPFSNAIRIDLGVEKSGHLNIYLPNGKKLYSNQIQSGQSLDGTALPKSGLYLFEIILQDGVFLEKVIKI